SSEQSRAAPIRADLNGDDTCTTAGLTVRVTAPVLVLCGALLASGVDPKRRLHAYRGDTLALAVRSIGEGARLRVASHGVGFERLPECTGATPVRKIPFGLIRQ